MLAVVLVSLNLRMAVTSVPPVLDQLGLGSAGQSVLVTLPVLCFSLGALAGPRLRSLVGEERAILCVVCLLLFGLGFRAVLPAVGLFAGTICAGLAIAVLNVLLPSLVKRRFPSHVGAMMATYTTVMTLGAGLAAGLTVPVFDAADKSIGLALGVWAVPAAIALAVWLPQAAPRPAATAQARHQAGGIRLWRKLLAWEVLLFMGLQSVAFYGPLSWIPAIYRDHGVGAAKAGVLLLVMSFVSMATNVAAPLIAHRMRDQRLVIAISVALTGAGIAALLVAPTLAPVAWMVVLGLGQGATISLALLVIVLRAPDSDTAARLSGMAQSGGYLLAAAGPLVMGLMRAATGSWTLGLVFLLFVVAAELATGIAAGRDRFVHAPTQTASQTRPAE